MSTTMKAIAFIVADGGHAQAARNQASRRDASWVKKPSCALRANLRGATTDDGARHCLAGIGRAGAVIYPYPWVPMYLRTSVDESSEMCYATAGWQGCHQSGGGSCDAHRPAGVAQAHRNLYARMHICAYAHLDGSTGSGQVIGDTSRTEARLSALRPTYRNASSP